MEGGDAKRVCYYKMFELFKQQMGDAPDGMFNDTISKGALKLNDTQIQTVSFVFWLCYMAEIDLNDALKRSWELSKSVYAAEVNEMAKNMLADMIVGGNKIDIDNLRYFIDKIKIHEVMVGKNEFTKILWKLNNIRNDISHNRINDLEYNNQSLYLRETKERILVDYFSAALNENLDKSKIWDQLSNDDKKDAEEFCNEIMKNNS